MGQEIKLPNGAKLIEMDNGDVEVHLKDVRASFFHGFDPQERRNDQKQLTGFNYNTALLIDKTTQGDQADLVKKGMGIAKKKTWGDSPPRLAGDKLCLRDGEPVDEESGNRIPLYDGYAGCFFVSANRPVKVEEYEQIKAGTKPRPVKIIGPRRGPDGKFRILNEGDEFAPYSGCYVNAVIRIYGYKSEDNPSRINASFEAVQFKRHGEAFGARGVDVDSAFDDEEVGEDEIGGGSATGGSSGGATGGDDFDIG